MTTSTTLSSTIRAIGEEVAGPAADAVDREARFPTESIGALRSAGVLGALVPETLGGSGAKLEAAAAGVATMAEFCASSALILAMHHIQVVTLVRHASAETLEDAVPELLAGRLLLANANSEVGLGGERRSSLCALEPRDGGFILRKQAATVSYGEYADGILATARRAPDSPPNEQVLAICLPPDLRVAPVGPWDTLGMRGTCSRPCEITATVSAGQVIDDYGTVFLRTALPASVILLSAVWLGIAQAATARAHLAVRNQARRARLSAENQPPPPGALRLAELGVVLHQLREVWRRGAEVYERVKDTDEVTGMAFSARMDNLKLASSTLVVDIVGRAMAICGMGGYANNGPLSMGRLSRDAAAAPLMINNDRVLHAIAQTLPLRKDM